MSGIVPFSPNQKEYLTVQSSSWQSVVQFHVHMVLLASSTPMENESTAQRHGRPLQEVSLRSDARRGATGMEYPSDDLFGCLADGRACAGGDAGRHALVRQASLGCTCYPHQACEAPPICSLTNSTPSAVGGAAPNGRPECAGSTVILTAEMDAPVAANGHAAEIDMPVRLAYRQ